MGGTIAQRLEMAVGAAAAASLGGAIGFAMYEMARTALGLPLAESAAAGGLLAIGMLPVARWLLRTLEGPARPFWQPDFAPSEFEPIPELAELVLTDADRLHAECGEDALELDDVLVEIGQDSRVVQLFDPSAMPTPGQLQARIDRHLRGGTSHSPSPDASEALFTALADLRRSLR